MTDPKPSRKSEELRAVADALDSLPGLPDLYITFFSGGGVGIQIAEALPLTDAERMSVADRLAAAFGMKCGVRSRQDDDEWTYGTPLDSDPSIYVPGIIDQEPT